MPFSASYRVKQELEAYKVQNAVLIQYGYPPISYDFMNKVFTGKVYYYMKKSYSKAEHQKHFDF